MCISVTRSINAESASYVYLIETDGAQNFSCVCMCIEFVLQVLKQKNAYVLGGFKKVFRGGFCRST